MSKIMTNLLDSVNSENAPFTFRENVINGYLIEFPVYFSARKEKIFFSIVMECYVPYQSMFTLVSQIKECFFKIKQLYSDKVHRNKKKRL